MLYGIYFTFLPRQVLGCELEEKQYSIFPPGPVFFLLVTEKLVKKLMWERKMVFVSHFHIFPPWTMLYLVPLLRQLRFWGAWKWWYLPINVHSSACKFVWIILIIALSTIFFSSILLPIALLSLAIVGLIQVNMLLTTLLCFLEKPTIWWFTMLTRLWSILTF